MTVQCKDCGNWALQDEMRELYGCPVCRLNRVIKAIKTVDTLRTAMGVLHTNVDWNSDKWKGLKARADAAMRMCQYGTWHDLGATIDDEQQAEVPRGCRIPTTEADQVYQLRRIFRM
jgi:predicted  nucleic acid-binding Zn-ribbon protein